MKIRIGYAVFFCLIIFSGCTIKDTVKSEQGEKVLRERIMNYCNYRIKQEFEKTYEFEDPLYRKKTNFSKYIRKMSGGIQEWKEAEIKNIKLDGDRADADLRIRLKVRFSLAGVQAPRITLKDKEHDTEITQKWIRVDGVWYHVFGGKDFLEQ